MSAPKVGGYTWGVIKESVDDSGIYSPPRCLIIAAIEMHGFL